MDWMRVATQPPVMSQLGAESRYPSACDGIATAPLVTRGVCFDMAPARPVWAVVVAVAARLAGGHCLGPVPGLVFVVGPRDRFWFDRRTMSET